jgi:hypothetical protein
MICLSLAFAATALIAEPLKNRTGEHVAIRKDCIAISNLKDSYEGHKNLKKGETLEQRAKLCIWGKKVILHVDQFVNVVKDTGIGLIAISISSDPGIVYFILRENLQGEVDWQP